MIHSMTGFGRATGMLGASLSATVTVRSVNHRFLEVSVRLPESLWELEAVIRAIGGQMFSRGKMDVSVRVQRTGESNESVRINRQALRELLRETNDLADELGIGERPGLAEVLSIAGMVEVESEQWDVDSAVRSDFEALVRGAFGQVLEMRRAEGEALAREVGARLAAVERFRSQVAGLRDEVIREALESYRQRVAEIAGTAGVDLDPDRLAQETVLLAEKGDVAEELARLSIHEEQMRKLIEGGDEPAGKKLDFLSQEMVREINTIGSKSRASAIRSAVIELKSEVERIREQVQNVE